jgi:hypothetical protein
MAGRFTVTLLPHVPRREVSAVRDTIREYFLTLRG